MRNLPVKSDNTIFCKIRNWFRNKFCKTISQSDKTVGDEKNVSKIDNEKDNFINQFKSNETKQISKDDVRRNVEKDFTLLDQMSLQQLKTLEEYYDELILKEKGKRNPLKINNKEDMRKLLERKPELLDRFSLEQLKELENYYDELLLKAQKAN